MIIYYHYNKNVIIITIYKRKQFKVVKKIFIYKKDRKNHID